MIIYLCLLISSLLAGVIAFDPESTYSIVKVEFIIYIAIIIIDMIKTKSLNLFQIWIFAFVYIILSEMLIRSIDDFLHFYSVPIAFYLLANNIVLFGYKLYKPKQEINFSHYKVRNSPILFLFILILMIFYLFFKFEVVLQSIYFGRVLKANTGNGTIIGAFVESIGLLLPCFIGYYFKHISSKNVLYSILFSLPIFIYQFIIATRFKLLFSVLPFLIITGIISLDLNKFKKFALLLVCAIMFGIGSSYISENRSKPLYNGGNSTHTTFSNAAEDIYVAPDIFQYIAREMSPEGIIYMARKANDYFENNSLSYGKETSFILYFWIPRSVWPNKPTMLDSWLIRKTENVSDSFSSASGFMGELRADFGWFSLIFAFFIGMMFKKMNSYISSFSVNKPSINYVFAVTFLSFTFFFVRSPLTSSMTLIGEYIVFRILRGLFFTKLPKSENL